MPPLLLQECSRRVDSPFTSGARPQISAAGRDLVDAEHEIGHAGGFGRLGACRRTRRIFASCTITVPAFFLDRRHSHRGRRGRCPKYHTDGALLEARCGSIRTGRASPRGARRCTSSVCVSDASGFKYVRRRDVRASARQRRASAACITGQRVRRLGCRPSLRVARVRGAARRRRGREVDRQRRGNGSARSVRRRKPPATSSRRASLPQSAAGSAVGPEQSADLLSHGIAAHAEVRSEGQRAARLQPGRPGRRLAARAESHGAGEELGRGRRRRCNRKSEPPPTRRAPC